MSTKLNEKTIAGFFNKQTVILALVFLFIGFFLGAQYGQSTFGQQMRKDKKGYLFEKNRDTGSQEYGEDDENEDEDADEAADTMEQDDINEKAVQPSQRVN